MASTIESLNIFRTIEELIFRIVDEEGVLAMDRLSGEETYHSPPGSPGRTRTNSSNLVLASKLREIKPTVTLQTIF